MKTTKHYQKLPVNYGGLLRCCSESLSGAFITENEGDTFECLYCKSQMIVKNGYWVWNGDKKKKKKKKKRI